MKEGVSQTSSMCCQIVTKNWMTLQIIEAWDIKVSLELCETWERGMATKNTGYITHPSIYILDYIWFTYFPDNVYAVLFITLDILLASTWLTEYGANPLMNMSRLLYCSMSSGSVCWLIFYPAHWDYSVIINGRGLISAQMEDSGLQQKNSTQQKNPAFFSDPFLHLCSDRLLRQPATDPSPPADPSPADTLCGVLWCLVFAPMYSRG